MASGPWHHRLPSCALVLPYWRSARFIALLTRHANIVTLIKSNQLRFTRVFPLYCSREPNPNRITLWEASNDQLAPSDGSPRNFQSGRRSIPKTIDSENIPHNFFGWRDEGMGTNRELQQRG